MGARLCPFAGRCAAPAPQGALRGWGVCDGSPGPSIKIDTLLTPGGATQRAYSVSALGVPAEAQVTGAEKFPPDKRASGQEQRQAPPAT